MWCHCHIAHASQKAQNYFQIHQIDKYELVKDFWFLSLMAKIKL